MVEGTSYSMRALAATLAKGSQPVSRETTEEWIESLGVKLVDVWFLRADGTWFLEKQVDDEDTIAETIGMTLERVRHAGYALRTYHGRWELTGPARKMRYYDTREAAEMVAIHNG